MKNVTNLISHYNEGKDFFADFIRTLDNSISIQIGKNEDQYELMHSESGAFSETIYIYLPVLESILKNNLKPIFLSIGLGAGYIEIMIVAFLMKNLYLRDNINDFCIESFESENRLIYFFKSYFLEKEIPTPFKNCYDHILELNANYFKLDKNALKLEIKNLIIANKINFNQKFLMTTNLKTPVFGIFFDAFSSHSSPELWETELIENIFSIKNAENKCIFATYASKNLLKKQLKSNQFHIHKKKGFSGKRECIYAERNLTS
ncbi:MnmC family methyltransferase [Silvanigrella sp.]|uniref:MnmC family methyltransferase n=1 Tax=Silvanigrella sp. TaxID=2024976 RepID=UPI0037CA463A